MKNLKSFELFEGSNYFNSKMKFYHCSGTKLKVGDVIGGPGKRVYMNTSPVPHGTIWSSIKARYSSYSEYSIASFKMWNAYWDKREEADKNQEPHPERPDEKTMNSKPKNITIYEVKPFKKPIFNQHTSEYIALDTFVEIVKIVGNANGILQNHLKKWGDGSKAFYFGGQAIRKK